MLSIIQYPHPVLRHVSKPLRRVDAEFRAIVAEMFELMYEAKGIGLAANQVGLPYRFFIANPTGDRSQKDQELVFINPVISKPRGNESAEEGCLSLPGLYAQVKRPKQVAIHAYNLSGQEIQGDLDGLLARIVQHETDHLDGVLFIDRVTPTQLADLQDELYDFEIVFSGRRERGEMPPDETLLAEIRELESLRC